MRTRKLSKFSTSEYRARIQGGDLNAAVKLATYYKNKYELLRVAEKEFPEEMASRARIQKWMVAVADTPGGVSALEKVTGLKIKTQASMRTNALMHSTGWEIAKKAMESGRGEAEGLDVMSLSNEKAERSHRLHERMKAAARRSGMTLQDWSTSRGLSKWLYTTLYKNAASSSKMDELERVLDEASAQKESPAPPAATTKMVTISEEDLKALFAVARDGDMAIIMAAMAALKKRFNGKTEGALQLLGRLQSYGIPLDVIGGEP
jgi:hypothetical protein